MLRKRYKARKGKKQRLESTGICGVLWKQGRKHRTWHKRFFMLQQNVISYFSAVDDLVQVVQQLSKAKETLITAKNDKKADHIKNKNKT
eukprot:UN03858